MKELPKVFVSPINKIFNNNSNMSYNKLEESSKIRDDLYVRDKINKIFKSDDRIYSIDCVITFEKSDGKYTIVGKTDNNLITNKQRLIPIKDIYDIKLP